LRILVKVSATRPLFNDDGATAPPRARHHRPFPHAPGHRRPPTKNSPNKTWGRHQRCRPQI